MIRFLTICVAVILSLSGIGNSQAGTCTDADIAAAVDQSAAQLRGFNGAMQPRLQDRMRKYAEAMKLPKDGFEEAALDAIQSPKLLELDQKSSDLLMKIDAFGRTGTQEPVTCNTRVGEIKGASDALIAVMREKSDYMTAALDRKIAEAGGGKAPPSDPPASVATNKDKIEKIEKPAIGAPTKPQPAAKPRDTPKVNDAYLPPQSAPVEPETVPPADDGATGYTIDEIREATRGFFGTVSTSLASVIEHAFKTSGRPTAYVLGTEGGGALLAGLRYGKGKLYLRHAPGIDDVFWHGPSLGTDLGASGARTMFLIYRLKDKDGLFRSFTGVEGSAFVVGGVGATLLKGGDVIMAPIRSGLGFRVGANIGYLRFTDHATWNPF